MSGAFPDGNAGVAPEGAGWRDGWYWSADGIRLHWRERPAASAHAGRPALLCLPGLTRNASDFTALGDRFAGRFRVIAVDLRGRGESAWPKDSLTYVAMSYLHDLGRLLEAAAVDRFIVLGSSVGGLLALQMVTAYRPRMAGVILNDIGPEVEPAGLARLRGLVGRAGNWPTWLHAARDFQTRHGAIYPEWQLDAWLAFAKRVCRLGPSGRIVFDYDPRIADAFRLPQLDHGTDFAAAFAMLAGLPVLSLRGERSDVLSRAGQARMAAVLPDLRVVEVPGVGHAPTLDEPAAVAALEAFLGQHWGVR
ncbi:alpha/beta hydrolase [alpha proteobacterium AAP81b]|nr:alpha/beta hydrolase [alpha proteobacterium AAP81b]